jgi:streptogramin lyase
MQHIAHTRARRPWLGLPIVLLLAISCLLSGCGTQSQTALPSATLTLTLTPTPKPSLAGTITEFPISSLSPSDSLTDIAAGPDGNLWFTEYGQRNKIGRMMPGGTVTEFPLPATDIFLAAITPGPDGNLWFADGGEIGRITTSGAITEFPLKSGHGAGGIVAGPDGNLWFTERGQKAPRLEPGDEWPLWP